MNILALKNLVSNGWNIANRRSLQRLIGKEELTKLTNAFKQLDESLYTRDIPARGDIRIPPGGIELSKRNGEFLLKFPVHLKDIYVRDNKQIFIGRDINLKTISERVKEYQQKVINYFKNAKELPESALESKTMRKLYTPEFKPFRRINEDGYHVTTLIDKKTGKPVEAYVKCISKSKSPYQGNKEQILDHEHWGIFVKNPQGEYELVGNRRFYIDKANKKLLPDWMDSENNLNRFGGIGLRSHQIGVERMMQENLDSIQICAEAQAFPFHYKSGFRIVPMQIEVTPEKIKSVLDFWEKQSGISKEVLEKAIISKNIDGKIIIDSKSMENWRKLLFLKNNGKYITGDTPMELRGEWLEKWKEMSKSQPILLD